MMSWPFAVPKPWLPTSVVNRRPSGAKAQPNGSADEVGRGELAHLLPARGEDPPARRRVRLPRVLAGDEAPAAVGEPADHAVHVAEGADRPRAAGLVGVGVVDEHVVEECARADRVHVDPAQPVALGDVHEGAGIGARRDGAEDRESRDGDGEPRPHFGGDHPPRAATRSTRN
jgi:hypothetical protein